MEDNREVFETIALNQGLPISRWGNNAPRLEWRGQYRDDRTQAAWSVFKNCPGMMRIPSTELPNGWKLVPASPTSEMMKAAANVECAGLRGFMDRKVYLAMLAAAPDPATPNELEGD